MVSGSRGLGEVPKLNPLGLIYEQSWENQDTERGKRLGREMPACCVDGKALVAGNFHSCLGLWAGHQTGMDFRAAGHGGT